VFLTNKDAKYKVLKKNNESKIENDLFEKNNLNISFAIVIVVIVLICELNKNNNKKNNSLI
jgi:hypothetical protein